MKGHIAIIIPILAVLAGTVSCGGRHGKGDEGPQNDSIPALGFWIEDHICDTTEIRTGETFTTAMARLGMEQDAIYELARNCDTVFDVRKMRAGNRLVGCYSGDSTSKKLEYVVYNNDKVRSTVFKCADSLAAWTYDKPTTLTRKICDVTIQNSLWNDMIASGNSTLLILNLADIYAWTVNFFGLQEGDRFRAIYTERSCEGEVIDIDNVEFCLFNSGDTEFPAIRFDQGDGGNLYWNEKGESMKKAFLKAPLQFTRISSRFTYHRKHPVTGKVRPHTAVDYAAPSGTPVHAIGDGVVTVCGWDPSGGGNRIKIRHMNGYETSYMHLRGYASGIRSGVHVRQGQTIGYVGSTGTSTGPHLDFRVWKDGKPVDPLKMISPPAEPLNKANMDSLQILYKKYKEELCR